MTKKIEVYNLESTFPGPEYTFTDVTPEWAVCYAEAQRTNRASFLFSLQQRGEDLSKHFNITRGKRSVACGHYSALDHEAMRS